jgi:ABC-type glycerol-3-phosphate transport system substrate-binding protein
LTIKGVLAFPAGDPDALYTLNLYQAAGGSIQDNQGRPTLDPLILSLVLDFYQKAEKASLLPTWLTLDQSDDQAWPAFSEQKAGMAITWASRYLKIAGKPTEDIAAAPLPTLNGAPYTLATGWVWALGNNKPGRQALAVELAEFLTQGEFLAGWTSTAGYLPPRSSALSAWLDTPVRSLASQVVLSARLAPSEDVLSSLGTVLQAATDAALGQKGSPEQLAQDAADQLKNP